MPAGAVVAIANQTPADVAASYAATKFIFQQLINGIATAAIVKVVACTNHGELARVGSVDVIMMVDMVTENGQTIPHGTIFRAPYVRMQGGQNAVILDPAPGDLGVCVFAARDVSAVKADPDAAKSRAPNPGAPPGSRRTFSYSDALYIGGLLNDVPTQYVQFTPDGIVMKSPQKVTIEAPTIELKGNVDQTDGDVTMAGSLVVDGGIATPEDVEAGTISLKDHIHPTVGTPPNTGEPVP